MAKPKAAKPIVHHPKHPGLKAKAMTVAEYEAKLGNAMYTRASTCTPIEINTRTSTCTLVGDYHACHTRFVC